MDSWIRPFGLTLLAVLVLSVVPTAVADVATEVGKAIGRAGSSEPVRSGAEAYGRGVNATVWSAQCNKATQAEALLASAQCFRLPDGRFLWELPAGVEREKWQIIAGEERSKRYRERFLLQQQQREEGRRQADIYRQNQLHCQFWQAQADSERQRLKMQEYCY